MQWTSKTECTSEQICPFQSSSSDHGHDQYLPPDPHPVAVHHSHHDEYLPPDHASRPPPPKLIRTVHQHHDEYLPPLKEYQPPKYDFTHTAHIIGKNIEHSWDLAPTLRFVLFEVATSSGHCSGSKPNVGV